jgi:hypothetical protein
LRGLATSFTERELNGGVVSNGRSYSQWFELGGGCRNAPSHGDLQLLNVPQTCASHGPSYRAHPRLYLRCRAGAWRMSGLLRVQPLGEVN